MAEKNAPKFKRILLKLSGEALMGKNEFGIDTPTCVRFAEEIKNARDAKVEIGIVIGGGNIFRGVSAASAGMDRSQADSMGMLATIINGLAMQNALERIGVATRLQSAIRMETVCEPFIRRKAIRHMEKGRVVIFAGGTGNPFFTTDSGAALRAAEMGCNALFKGTQVDGVYSSDPKSNPDAERYDHVGYREVLSRDLRIMDASAVSLMRDNNIPIVIFSLKEKGELLKVLHGEGKFTIISDSGKEN